MALHALVSTFQLRWCFLNCACLLAGYIISEAYATLCCHERAQKTYSNNWHMHFHVTPRSHRPDFLQQLLRHHTRAQPKQHTAPQHYQLLLETFAAKQNTTHASFRPNGGTGSHEQSGEEFHPTALGLEVCPPPAHGPKLIYFFLLLLFFLVCKPFISIGLPMVTGSTTLHSLRTVRSPTARKSHVTA